MNLKELQMKKRPKKAKRKSERYIKTQKLINKINSVTIL